jgi:glycosyltransferase involved in cell wall biosynthesis
VRLRVVGDASYRLEGATVESLPWKEATELIDLAAFDIGIMPAPDDRWAAGKCGLKALQTMALGVATVMSPVGVNASIAAGGAARLATTDAEWRRVLEELVKDGRARAELGVAGRRRVVERYSVRANLPLYAELLRDVAAKGRRAAPRARSGAPASPPAATV